MPYLNHLTLCAMAMMISVAGLPANAQDFSQRYQQLQAGAAQGDSDAAYDLGVLYLLGSRAERGGPEQDEARGLDLLRPLAENGDARAQWRLGRAYEFGNGVARDADQAYIWYRAAADQGLIHVMQPLGRMYLDGRGAPQDAATAYDLFRQGAEAGNLRAKIALARLYQDAERAPVYDPSRAVHWFRQAAQQDDSNGVRGLSNAYLNGLGVARDPIQALRVYVEYEQRSGRQQTNAMLRILSQMTDQERAEVDAVAHAENWGILD